MNPRKQQEIVWREKTDNPRREVFKLSCGHVTERAVRKGSKILRVVCRECK